MKGFVAVTDSGWYEHLRARPGPQDANFWRPSARTLRLEVGTPFLFKLKAPHHAIGGFGYFAGFSVLPDWLAWETFEEANGVDSFAALQSRLSRIRKGAGIERDPAGRIGCCLIAEAVFFEPERGWLAPRDWKRNIVDGRELRPFGGRGREDVDGVPRTSSPTETTDAPAVYEDEARYGKPNHGRPAARSRPSSRFEFSMLTTVRVQSPKSTRFRSSTLPTSFPTPAEAQHEVSNGLLLRCGSSSSSSITAT